RGREQQPGAGPAGAVRAAQRGLFRLPGRVALVEADQCVPRFSAAQSSREPIELNAGCGELTRIFCSQATALRFLQTSQDEFPLVTSRVKRDIPPCAILHRREFPGLENPE